MKIARVISIFAACGWLLTGTLAAHEVRPAFLELKERVPGEFDVLWKVPAMGGPPLAGEELPHPQPPLLSDDSNLSLIHI